MGDYNMVSGGYKVDLLSQKGLQVRGFPKIGEPNVVP